MAGLEVEEMPRGGGRRRPRTYVTPNRGDCLSMVGVAREVAAITGLDVARAAVRAAAGWAAGAGRSP